MRYWRSNTSKENILEFAKIRKLQLVKNINVMFSPMLSNISYQFDYWYYVGLSSVKYRY